MDHLLVLLSGCFWLAIIIVPVICLVKIVSLQDRVHRLEELLRADNDRR